MLLSIAAAALPAASAWWATGHMVTGQIAYNLLTPTTKGAVDALADSLADSYPASPDFVTVSMSRLLRMHLTSWMHWLPHRQYAQFASPSGFILPHSFHPSLPSLPAAVHGVAGRPKVPRRRPVLGLALHRPARGPVRRLLHRPAAGQSVRGALGHRLCGAHADVNGVHVPGQGHPAPLPAALRGCVCGVAGV